MNHLTYLKDVVTLKLDQEKCTGCGMCLEVCPHEVFKMNTRHVEIQNRDACMECGACTGWRRMRGGRDQFHAGENGSALLRSHRIRMLAFRQKVRDLLRIVH
jgi:ferredoxin